MFQCSTENCEQYNTPLHQPFRLPPFIFLYKISENPEQSSTKLKLSKPIRLFILIFPEESKLRPKMILKNIINIFTVSTYFFYIFFLNVEVLHGIKKNTMRRKNSGSSILPHPMFFVPSQALKDYICLVLLFKETQCSPEVSNSHTFREVDLHVTQRQTNGKYSVLYSMHQFILP